VTGDKKSQAFEDGYLDELFDYLINAGFKAVTYMPSRNTEAQLTRVIALCERRGLFQISGEDINSPFQPFICEALAKPMFKHLQASALALIGHETSETGMFAPEIINAMPGLDERINYFAGLVEK